MQKIIKPLILLILGLLAGGGGALGVSLLMPPASGKAAAGAHKPEPTGVFVAAEPLVVPVANAQGTLSGYVQIIAQVEVAEEQAEAVPARMPFFLHEVNMRLWGRPIAAGLDEMLPDLARFRTVTDAAAKAAFGKGEDGRPVVRSTVVSSIRPL